MREDMEKALQADLLKLIGCTLVDIVVATFRVDFIFSENMTITVRITKEFKFALSKHEELRFDIGLVAHDVSVESSKFVIALPQRDARRTKLEVGLESDARL